MFDSIFNPKGIALIGASSNPSKLGYQILRNIIDGEYKGDIFLISQSGSISTVMLDWVKQNYIGLSRFVSIGNKVDLNENDFIKNLEKDEILGLFLENISNGKELLNLGKTLSNTNPIIV